MREWALIAALLLTGNAAAGGISHGHGGVAPGPIAVLEIGQSNKERDWCVGNFTMDLVTNGTTSASSAMWGNLPYPVSGAPLTGTNIPGSTTFSSSGSGGTLTLSNAAVGSGSGGTLDLFFPHLTTTGNATRYQGGSAGGTLFHPLNDPEQTDEGEYSTCTTFVTYGFAPGAIAEANSMLTTYSVVRQFQMAIGSTFACDWVSGTVSTCSGAGFQYNRQIANSSTGFLHNGLGISTFQAAVWQQGEQDAAAGTSTANYLLMQQNILAWVKAFSGAPPFMVTVLGNVSSTSSDVNADKIVQSQLQLIDAGNGAFYGSSARDIPMSDPPHWTSAGRVTMGCRQANAALKALGKQSAGYGPAINAAGVVYDSTNIVTIPVTQETGTALRGANQVTSGVGLTGFVVTANGSPVSYTSSFSGNNVLLAIGTQTRPIVVTYAAGAAPAITNMVYDNAALTGPNCTPGFPLQPSRGPGITAG